MSCATTYVTALSPHASSVHLCLGQGCVRARGRSNNEGIVIIMSCCLPSYFILFFFFKFGNCVLRQENDDRKAREAANAGTRKVEQKEH